MNPPPPAAKNILLPVGVVCFLGAIWVFHLLAASAGFSLFRDQHLGAALDFAEHGIDLLRPVIPGFTATGTPTPLEIPLWQASAALALRWMGGWWGAANVTSLVFFSLSLLPLFALARRELGRDGAWWTLGCFLSIPLVFWQAGIASTDMFSLGIAIWFIYFADRLIGRLSFLNFALCLLAGVLSALSKMPFYMEAGMAAAIVLWLRRGWDWKVWLALSLVGAISLAAAVAWSKHIDAMVALAEFQFRGVTLKEVPEFYFGSLSYRLNPMTYVRAGWISLSALCGSFVLIALPVYGLVVSRKGWGVALLAGFCFTALVFFKVVATHKHYYLMLTPAVALLSAAAIQHLLGKFRIEKPLATLAVTVMIFAVMGLATIQGLMALEVPQIFDSHARQMTKIIMENVAPESKILMANGGWGGDMFIRSGRNGLSIDTTARLSEPAKQKRLAELGYDTFVALSESPLLDAVQRTNPGSFGRKRQTWELATSPVDRDWPVIYSDEHIVIKKIIWADGQP